ncbi:MAG: hypothetical protein Kow0062_17750 [Acidobacteriota bacterium]
MVSDRTARGLTAALLAFLAFALLGSRAPWEPDEGRYIGAAREMVLAGDWLVPQLHGAPHLTKPPATYWAIGAGLALLGMNGWGARLYLALAYLATCALTGLLGRELLGAGRGRRAAIAFGLALLPFVAASVATTDMLLAACETAAVYAWWRARRTGRTPWRLATGAALGLAFLVKGPPGLLPVAGIVAWELWRGRRDGRWRAPWGAATAAAFALVGLPWYLWAMARLPGLAGYFLGEEVAARVASDAFHRNAGFTAGLRIYGLALLAGGLPWTVLWLARAARRLAGRGAARAPRLAPETAFALCWFAVPFTVFLVASSRMYLYVVPLFVPLALLTVGRGPTRETSHRVARVQIAAAVCWALLLVGIRWQAAVVETHRDAGRIAARVAPLLEPGPARLVQIDARVHGLDFVLGRRSELRVTRRAATPHYWPQRPAEPALRRIAASPLRHVVLAPADGAPRIVSRLGAAGRAARVEPIGRGLVAVVVPGRKAAARPRALVVSEPRSVADRFLAADAVYALCEELHPHEVVVVTQAGRSRLAGLLWDLPAEDVTVRTADGPPDPPGVAPPPGRALVVDAAGAVRGTALAADVPAPRAQSRRKNISVSIASQSR